MIFYLVFACLCTVSVLCDEGQKEVDLFHQVDLNNDDQLTRAELDAVFLLFDTNQDNQVTPTEFVAAWQKFNLGGPQDAQTLFTRADTNDDGIIDAKDIPAIFAFFDQNGDGVVDINEFLTVWGELVLHPAGTVDVSVDVMARHMNLYCCALCACFAQVEAMCKKNVGSGLVDISEFLTQWAALQNEPTDESNVSVDIAG